jgi:ABC-type branched-subunit amino acid transport system ATPase component
MSTEVTFELQGVTKQFGSVTAVDDVTVTLGGTGITALVGANGAGKTTLFNLITGQLRATTGRIRLDGTDVTRYPAQDMARLGIARSFQDIRLFAGLSTRDNVIVYAQERHTGGMASTMLRPLRSRRSARTAARNADEILEYLHIRDLRDRPAGSLSYAQQKVVAIARLIALKPRIVFLDEPASGLDEPGRRLLVGVIERLVADGMPICLVEHNTHLVRQLANRVLFVSGGRILADGSPEEVFANQTLAELYLGLT